MTIFWTESYEADYDDHQRRLVYPSNVEREFGIEGIEEYVARLPERERHIVELRCAGASQSDIGRIVGMTQAGVCHAIQRAIQRIKWMVSEPPKPENMREVLVRVLIGSKHPPDLCADLIIRACEVTSLLRVANEMGIKQNAGRRMVLKAKSLECPVGEYVRHRLPDDAMTLAFALNDGVERVRRMRERVQGA